jgi:hypothetical protein
MQNIGYLNEINTLQYIKNTAKYIDDFNKEKEAMNYKKEYDYFRKIDNIYELQDKLIYNPDYNEDWVANLHIRSVFLQEYILNKYRDLCCLLPNTFELVLIYDNVYNVYEFYIFNTDRTLNLVYDSSNKTIKKKSISGTTNSIKSISVLNLLISNNIDILRNNIKQCSKRFILIPLYLTEASIRFKIGHSNFIIYDKISKTFEHFEPHGSLQVSNIGNKQRLYIELNNFFTQLIPYCIYLSPNSVCPNIGPQALESILCEKHVYKSTSPGYCYLWSIWYVELRLHYPDELSKSLIINSVRNLGDSYFDICKFIIAYSMFVNNFVNNFVNEKQFIDKEKTLNKMSFLIKKIIKPIGDKLKSISIKKSSIKKSSIKNNSIKNNSIKNNSIKNNSIKNNSIKNNSIKNNSIKNNS